MLAGSLWLALRPPRGLTTSRLARLLGVGAAFALGAGLLVVARLRDEHWGVVDYAFLGPAVTYFLVSAVVAAADGSLWAGLQATVWTALVGSLLMFVVWLVEAARWYRIDGSLLLDGESGYPIGENLADAVIWLLVLGPVWTLPFGVFGAVAGRAWRRRQRAGVLTH